MSPKSNSLSDTDIKKIINAQGVKLNGIYMRDEFNKQKLKAGFYVVNMQSSKDGNGTHWVCLYYTPNYSFYYDPYGFIAPTEIDVKIRPYIYNTIDNQSYNSSACGYFCIAFIIYMNEFKNKLDGFLKFIHLFSTNTKDNDKILYKLLYD